MDPFLAEIRPFAGNFAPKGWFLCDGSLLPIAQYSALFSLLGTTYGGNGTTNFALPNLMNPARAAMGMGAGPGLTPRYEGETLGESTVTVTVAQIPAHTHQAVGSNDVGTTSSPEGGVLAGTSTALTPYQPPDGSLVHLAANAVGVAGSNLPHDNNQPYLGLTYIIAYQGISPSRG